MGKKEKKTFVIDIPGRNLEVSVSSSHRGALTRVIARKVYKTSSREETNREVGLTMNLLDKGPGGAERLVYEVNPVFGDGDSYWCEIADIIGELSEKRGGKETDHVNKAKEYLSFVNRNLSTYRNK